MKIVCISDTHNHHSEVELPEGDVLIHAGDATSHGDLEDELEPFAKWFCAQPFEHKIFVPGNHDKGCENHPEKARRLFHKSTHGVDGVHYLVDEVVMIEGVKFYGSPWVINLPRWAFSLDAYSAAIREIWSQIPDDTDVLVTHGPPFGKLDQVKGFGWAPENVGSPLLLKRVEEVLPKYHVFGHIHEGHGVKQGYERVTTFINAAICTVRYRPTNNPICFHIEKEDKNDDSAKT